MQLLKENTVIRYNNQYYQFKPTLLGWLVTLICIPLFIKFGFWQYGKAQHKMDVQSAYAASLGDSAASFPIALNTLNETNTGFWQYKKVALKGEYDTQYQVLLDNKVEQTRAGYHVITPLKVEGSNRFVMVNRGWIPANHSHANVPKVKTPSGSVSLVGQVWVPSTKFYTLEDTDALAAEGFKSVWQHMDFARYKTLVPFDVSPLMVKLDPNSDAGGFVRNWQVPVKRIATHIGYAYQWFGFAVATLLIFIYMSMVPSNSRIAKE